MKVYRSVSPNHCRSVSTVQYLFQSVYLSGVRSGLHRRRAPLARWRCQANLLRSLSAISSCHGVYLGYAGCRYVSRIIGAFFGAGECIHEMNQQIAHWWPVDISP